MSRPTPTELQTGAPLDPREPAMHTLPPPAERPSGEQPHKPKRGWIWLIVLVVVGAAAYYYWPKIKALQSTSSPTPTGGRGKKGGGTTQVVAARAHKGNIGVYDNGLGAVTPVYTILLRSRVDGELMRVLFKEGQIVKKGELLAEIDPRPYQVQLDQAQGQLLHDQALLKNAHVDLDRYKVLLNQQAIPEQQYATQEALVTQYEGTIKTDQAAIDSAKLNLTYSHITAPIDGRVGLRLVDPGNIVHATDTTGLLVITQLDPISVIFTIAEDQLPAVQEKMHAGAHLRVEAWDRENKNKLSTGTLDTIDNQIDPTTGTLRLRANFENKDGKLFPSQFVNARLLVEEKSGVVVMPNAAIQRNSQATYVWLVKPDSTVTIRQITTGVTEGDQTEIKSGLAAGDEVVMVGVDRLLEGSRVNAQVPGEASKDGGDKTGGRSGGKAGGKTGKGKS
jgi:multidrug efflux system membrane fusion protein